MADLVGRNSDEKALLKYLQINKEDLILSNWDNDFEKSLFTPGYYVALDHKEKSIMLALRGTLNIGDVITDLVASNTNFLNGYGHSGMVLSSLNLAEKLRETLIQLNKVSNGNSNKISKK